MHYTRRNWLKTAALSGIGTALSLPNLARHLHPLAVKTILLHSSWQTVNIGDVGHTPGLIKILNDQLPDAQIILWPKSSLDRGVEAMLRAWFPQLRIVNGPLDEQDQPGTAELRQAFDEADFMLHGSGPSVVGWSGLDSWHKVTGKPYGIYGVTIQEISPQLEDLLKGAAFVYTRETHSLKNLSAKGIRGEHTGFAPDATFAMHLLDDEKAQAFMQQHDLQARQFICVIPRLRKTPYYKIRPNNAGWSPQQIDEVDTLNAQHKEKDHAKARYAMIEYVRQTGHKVLICPEMTYQLDIMDELLIDPLPEDVKKQVVKRENYWLPDEASSIYKQALALLSFECHSPIMAFYHGTPAFYLRQPEDTIKGQMWYDIGVDKWVFEIEETEGPDIARQLMRVVEDFDRAQAYREQAMQFVRKRHTQTMQYAKNTVFKT
ncbi:MAG: polysaccharide pyruvyl transferase family protein [Cyclobacteriaceae bacterium]